MRSNMVSHSSKCCQYGDDVAAFERISHLLPPRFLHGRTFFVCCGSKSDVIIQQAQQTAAMIRGSRMKPGAWPQPSGASYFLLETTSIILTTTVNPLCRWTWTFHQKIPQIVIFTVIIQTPKIESFSFDSQTFILLKYAEGCSEDNRWGESCCVYPHLTGGFGLFTLWGLTEGQLSFRVSVHHLRTSVLMFSHVFCSSSQKLSFHSITHLPSLLSSSLQNCWMGLRSDCDGLAHCLQKIPFVTGCSVVMAN